MKLYVPEIGDELKLTKDWTFNLHWEPRNNDLIKLFFNEEFRWSYQSDESKGPNGYPKPVTFPAGTILKVDRIYIRQGAAEYSSLSFYALTNGAKKGDFGKPKSPRFWATLQDCNKIEYEIAKASASTIKLECDRRLIKQGEYCGRDTSIKSYSIQAQFFLVTKDAKPAPVLKIKVEAGTKWEKQFGTLDNVKYSLHTMQDEKIGEWKSIATLKKKAKEWVAVNMPPKT